VVDLLADDVVMVEIIEPHLGDGLDHIVVASPSKLRRIDPSPSPLGAFAARDSPERPKAPPKRPLRTAQAEAMDSCRPVPTSTG
jgi:hypothetical protein